MGERTRFHPGDKAPNNGIYIEVGENAVHMGVEHPRRIELSKGDKLPDNENGDRVWVLETKRNSH